MTEGATEERKAECSTRIFLVLWEGIKQRAYSSSVACSLLQSWREDRVDLEERRKSEDLKLFPVCFDELHASPAGMAGGFPKNIC